MKIALFFLLCFISTTWQQNVFWSFPPRRIPFYSESRALFGLNYWVSMILSSLTLSSTSTSYTTTTSTITAATVVTCFTSTMFSDTTACRRKRNADSGLLIGDIDDENLKTPLNIDNMATGTLELPREGRDIDPSQLIASSQNEENVHPNKPTESSVDRYSRKNRNIVISFTMTSTVTSYSVYYSSSSTRIVTNLAATTALSCLPSGFSLC